MPRPPPPATALTNSGYGSSAAAATSASTSVDGLDADASVGTPAALAAAIARALLPVSVEHVGGRADEGDAGVGAGLGERGVLRQEAVAGVDRVGAGLHGDRDDRLGVEVGAHRVAALADLVGLVGLQPVLGPAVLVGEDRDRPARRARTPRGRRGSRSRRGWPRAPWRTWRHAISPAARALWGPSLARRWCSQLPTVRRTLRLLVMMVPGAIDWASTRPRILGAASRYLVVPTAQLDHASEFLARASR